MVECRRILEPADRKQAAQSIVRLLNHYPQTSNSDEMQALRIADWLEDFADVPADCLEAACAAWRRSPERFAPTPGQLMDKLPNWFTYRSLLLARAEKVLAAIEWSGGKPVTLHEYSQGLRRFENRDDVGPDFDRLGAIAA